MNVYLKPIECGNCGEIFQPIRDSQKFCGPNCRSKKWVVDNLAKNREIQRNWFQNRRKKGWRPSHKKAIPVDPTKHAARYAVCKAIRHKEILRPKKCSNCGIECVPEAHHPDYTKPLEVIWLCHACHGLTWRKPDDKPQETNVHKIYSPRTHCKHGHAIIGKNLRLTVKGRKACRICARYYAKATYWLAALGYTDAIRGLNGRA